MYKWTEYCKLDDAAKKAFLMLIQVMARRQQCMHLVSRAVNLYVS